jgi:AraC-like DNA-binding protein
MESLGEIGRPQTDPSDPARPLNMTTRRVESPLGSWSHSEAKPPHLTGILDRVWLFEGSMASLRERTFPTGLPEIIVHLGERYKDVSGDRVTVCPATCVTGMLLGPMIVEAPPRETTVLGIRLTAAGAYAIFARPMHDLTGLTVDLEDLTGRAAVELQDFCGATRNPRDRIARAVTWLDRRLGRGTRADPAVVWSLEQIRRHGGAVSISALREQAGLSSTRMAIAFREQVGVTAKQYARILRFQRVLRRIHAGTVSLADLAHEAGYYDQPHMTAEVKALSGLTPTALIESRRYPGSASVAE